MLQTLRPLSDVPLSLPPIVSITAAARRVGLSPRMIRNAIEDGRLETRTISGRIWVTRDSLLRFEVWLQQGGR